MCKEWRFHPITRIDRTFLVSIRGQGLLSTEDWGQTFVVIGDKALAYGVMKNFEHAASPIVFSPAYVTDQTIYALGSAAAEVFRSTDGGQSWQTLSVPGDPAFAQYQNNQYDLLTRMKLGLYLYRGK